MLTSNSWLMAKQENKSFRLNQADRAWSISSKNAETLCMLQSRWVLLDIDTSICVDDNSATATCCTFTLLLFEKCRCNWMLMASNKHINPEKVFDVCVLYFVYVWFCSHIATITDMRLHCKSHFKGPSLRLTNTSFASDSTNRSTNTF